ncbi:MAG: hypothetical protein JZU63_08945, partial [Rhodoferax sp.]|nr:hypothetical protein [Rhodoferax sp.]
GTAFFDDSRCAYGQRTWRNNLIVEYDSICRNNCPGANAHSVQHHCPGRHLGAIFDDAAFKMDDVANNAVIANDGRILWRGVNDRVVLNARARADLDVSIIAAENCTGPNR